MEVCHRNSIIHSDLKPANFVTVASGLKIIDFGIARAKHHDHTSVLSQERLGTVSYMSPEHIANESPVLRPSTDIWALGCILYQMIWGYTPYHHVTGHLQRALAVVKKPVFFPVFPKSITGGDPITEALLKDILERCLAKNEKRRPTVDDLLKHPFVTGVIAHTPFNVSVASQQQQPQKQVITPSLVSSALTTIIHEQREAYAASNNSHNSNNSRGNSTHGGGSSEHPIKLPPELCSALCHQTVLQQLAAVLSDKLGEIISERSSSP